jgi:hypothetical protein
MISETLLRRLYVDPKFNGRSDSSKWCGETLDPIRAS